MKAIVINFTVPTGTSAARITAECQGACPIVAEYAPELTLEQNAKQALDCFILTNPNWAGEWALGSFDGGFIAVMVPERFVKARDAVILTRRAISSGESNGNAHCKPWGQAITDLTDGNQGQAFASEYAAAVLRGV